MNTNNLPTLVGKFNIILYIALLEISFYTFYIPFYIAKLSFSLASTIISLNNLTPCPAHPENVSKCALNEKVGKKNLGGMLCQ